MFELPGKIVEEGAGRLREMSRHSGMDVVC